MSIREMTSAEAADRACIGPVGSGGASGGGFLRMCVGDRCMAWAHGPSRAGTAVIERIEGHDRQFGQLSREKPALYWVFEPDGDSAPEFGKSQTGTWVGYEKLAIGHCAFIEKAGEHR